MKKIAILKRYLPVISTCVLFFLTLSFWLFSPSFSNTTTGNEWDGSIADSFAGGNGTEENPFIIENGSQLAYLKLLLEDEEESTLYIDKHFKLSNDIHLGEHDFYIKNEEAFTGSLDGDAYTISNAKITDSFFASLEEATIKNINFKSIVIENTEGNVSALISVESINSTFKNITASLTYEVNEDNFVGTFIGIDDGSTLKNVILNADYNITSEYENKVAAIIYSATNTELENIIVKENDLDNFLVENDVVLNNLYEYKNDNFDIIIDSINLSELLESLVDASADYEYIILNGKIVFSKKHIPSIDTETTFPGLSASASSLSSFSSSPFILHASGITGNALYINDLEADWNYYYGLNYASSSTGVLPTGANQGLYNENNLVRVQLTYSALDPIGNLTGYVSLTELQSKYVYYKYYPIVNNKINIELIDNPFVNRPTDKAFNNWVADGAGEISIDYTTYKRYMELDVTYTAGIPDDIAIDLHASWVDAKVYNITAVNWGNVFNGLNAKTMTKLTTTTRDYSDLPPYDMGSQTTQYFYQVIIPRNSSQAGYYNASGTVQSGNCNTNPSCTLYQLILPETYYLDTNIYYRRTNGGTTGAISLIANDAIPRPYNLVSQPQYAGNSMAGYFVPVTIANGTSRDGYYSAAGDIQTGNCTTSAGCALYKLLQTSSNPIHNVSTDYYYMVTRDTNIAVMRINHSTIWSSANQNSKPFTLTMVYNGVDYRGSYAWTVSSINVQAYADTVIEYLKTTNSVNSNGTSPTSNTQASYVYGNHLNLKIGRGMTGTGNRTFGGVFGGGSSNLGSTSAYRRYNLIVESGNYNNIVITEGTSTAYINQATAITGNDYDRISGVNTNLDVSYAAYGVTGGTINSQTSSTKAIYHNVRSGRFGGSLTDAYTGIYTGGRGGTLNMESTIKVDGGWINLINGGPGSGTNRRNINHIFINVTGGEVGNIYGGAGTSDAQGNRILNITGGKINYSVFGGSNSSSGSTGYMAGSSLVYVGGTAQIGDEALVANNINSQFSNEAGSVFGIGNGASGASLNGTMVNSNVIIDGNALVLRNVYGGGNRAVLGTTTVANGGTATPVTNIDIKGGTINGDVYGGSNQGNTGVTSITGMNATLNVKVSGGHIKGSVYGGSNNLGIVYGSANLYINGGLIENSVYGGGRGGGTSGTFIRNNINVVIGDNGVSTTPTIKGNVYGGSALGTVNGITATAATAGATTNVTVNKGIVQSSVFGGAQGSTAVTPYVHGNVTVNINNGNIGQVYGANDAAGSPAGSLVVYLKGGIIGNAYGGGNQTSANNTQVFLQGSTVSNIFGGSNISGTVTSSTVTLTSGKVGTVYGGNNQGGTTTTSTVNVNGAVVTNDIYGGGNLASTGTTNLNLNSASGIVLNIYGGGRSASVTTSNITQNGVFVEKLFGGSNITGTVLNSYITYNMGIAGTVYGGNNAGGATVTSTVNMHAGSIGKLYGGGSATGGTNTIINLHGGGITEVYGGSDISGNIVSTLITIPQNSLAVVETIYGGNNAGGITTNATINVNGGRVGTVYGGGNLTATGSTEVVVKGGIISTLYGGGNSAAVQTNTKVSVTRGRIIRNVYGGGNLGIVNGNADVSIVDSSIGSNVYGGGNGAAAIVAGNTNVSIGGTTVVGEKSRNYEASDFSEYLSLLSLNPTVTGVYNEPFTDYRYQGLNVNNYVTFNNELWRIIGVFDENSHGKTGQNLIKIVKETPISNIAWDTNNVNNWATSSLYNTLNGSYYNSLSQNYRNMVENTAWNISPIAILNGLMWRTYNMERGGKQNQAFVGLSYTSDYYFSMDPSTCNRTTVTSNTVIAGCHDRSWMNTGINFWLLGAIQSENANTSYYVANNGSIPGAQVYFPANVRPTLYLNEGVISTSGDGSLTNPYQLSLDGEQQPIDVDLNVVFTEDGVWGSVFGSGNAAATGSSSSNNSTSSVNIAGGTINGNVYGGANTSVVYGTTKVNIGINAVTTPGMVADDIYISGTIFGGGEANASGSEEYDYSFISVTQGVDVLIDGSGHKVFGTSGSIFGSGNASSSAGESTITIKNYGKLNSPQKNISIQRTHVLTIDNSSIMLSGASDRTNEFSDVPFSFSLIDLLRLKNNSNLFLETGANVLKRLDSLTAGGQIASVSIDEDTKAVTKNVDNRIYILEGRNINIANNENVTSFGEVNGMSFFGMFNYNHDGSPNMGIYNPSYGYGDRLNWGIMPSKGSYVLGLHKVNHNIEVDGFYSHFMDTETETNSIEYVIPTPEDAAFYMWSIGEPVIEYEIDLVASKFATLGTAELSFLEFTSPNTSFQVLGFDASGIKSGMSLVDSLTIPRVASDSQTADTVMGLSMKSGLSGWLTSGETKYFTDSPSTQGTMNYIGDNSTSIQSLVFYLYHSKNLSEVDDLGSVRISMMVTTRIDALNYEQKRVNIIVNLSTALYLNNAYEGTMTAGREYDIFASSVVNITSKSALSAYYSLYIEGDSIYKPGVHRALVSGYVLPVNTKITMIDFAGLKPTYYYRVITQADVTRAEAEYALYGEASYNLSLFTKMGSLSSSTNYDDASMNAIYYDDTMKTTDEEFIFIVDFDGTDIQNDKFDNSLLIEMRDSNDQTIMNVLGIQHSSLTYNVHVDKNAYIDVTASINPTELYVGHRANLNVNTSFVNSRFAGSAIFDTSFFDSKLGLKITLIDSNGDVVPGTSLMGLSFVLDGFRYFPSIDGATRVKMADRVGNISQDFVMDLANTTLPTGVYTIKIEAFSSPDGIYYGSTTTGVANVPVIVVNDIYGLNAIIDDESAIIDATTGFNQKGVAAVEHSIDYHSGLNNPSIRLQMFRREYDEIHSTEFVEVDLADYASGLVSTNKQNEYLILNNPNSKNSLVLLMKSNLLTGTYRFDYNLYDGNVFIGKVSRYIIIK